MSGVITLDGATITTLLSLSSGGFAILRFNRPPEYKVSSIVHPPKSLHQIVATGAADLRRLDHEVVLAPRFCLAQVNRPG